MIIDEFTGRILEGRRWSEGLHQAIEAKEGVRDPRGEPDARDDHAPELLPPLRQALRHDGHGADRGPGVHEDLRDAGGRDPDPPADGPRRRTTTRSTRRRRGKWKALVNEIKERNEAGQPILIGTISVEVSEMLGAEFKRNGIDHVVLNAKPEHAQREGETISQAGRIGAVTIATNMAGRGVDIKLGGDPEAMAQAELAKKGLKPGDEGYDEAVARVCPRSRSSARPRATRSASSAASTSAAPSATSRGGSTTSFAAAPAARATPASRASSSRPRTTSSASSPATASTRSSTGSAPSTSDGRGVPARGEDAHEADRERPEEGRAAELPDQKARPRVRRRDERAAPRRLQVPARDPRGPRHVGGRARRGRPGAPTASSRSSRPATSSRSGTSPASRSQAESIWPLRRRSRGARSERPRPARRSARCSRDDILSAYEARERGVRRRADGLARAPGPPADHRQPLARAPLRDGLPARGHPPARLRADRPARRLQERGLHRCSRSSWPRSGRSSRA